MVYKVYEITYQGVYMETAMNYLPANVWDPVFVWRCNGISCKRTDQLDHGLECLQGISDNIPTLAGHGIKFIESIEFEGLFNK